MSTDHFYLQICYLRFCLSNGHSPQIRENGELLVRMWRGELHFSQKWRLANVGESGEYSVNGFANVGEFGESAKHGSANVGEFGESAQHGLASLAHFRKRPFWRVLARNSPFLASASTSLNSLNSPASSHCLVLLQPSLTVL